MNRTRLVLALLLVAGVAPAHAQLDSTIAAAQLAEQKAMDAFMHTQVVQEILLLRQTYNASVSYINEWQALNTGKGLLYNVGQQLQAAQNTETRQISQQFMSNWNSKGPAQAQVLYNAIDQTIAANITYAGNEIANVISNRQTGVNVAQNASSLSPKDAANQAAKSQGLQIQMLVQLHEDNVRLLQLLSLQLSSQTNGPEAQQTQIQNIQQSIQTHYPSAQLNTGAGQ